MLQQPKAVIGPTGWEVHLPPGPLSQHLAILAQDGPVTMAMVKDQPTAIVSFTPALEAGIKELTDSLLDLLHDAGKIQLALFADPNLITEAEGR